MEGKNSMSWKWEALVWLILEGVAISHINHKNPTSTALLKSGEIPTVEGRTKFKSPKTLLPFSDESVTQMLPSCR